MIARFRFSAEPGGTEISVNMQRRVSGAKVGTIVVPDVLEDALAAVGLPEVGEELSLDMAVGYAVILAIRSELSLCLCGDRSVWDPNWGKLIDRKDLH